jgi:hypothetical protein
MSYIYEIVRSGGSHCFSFSKYKFLGCFDLKREIVLLFEMDNVLQDGCDLPSCHVDVVPHSFNFLVPY